MLSERSIHKQNLPASVSSFIGREQELREIRQRLPEHRLITLTGTGGTGKTRLALEAAAGALDQFADGVWLVELAGLSTSDLVAQTIANVLTLPETPDLAPITRLGAFLQARRAAQAWCCLRPVVSRSRSVARWSCGSRRCVSPILLSP